jgi:hypothetical protein
MSGARQVRILKRQFSSKRCRAMTIRLTFENFPQWPLWIKTSMFLTRRNSLTINLVVKHQASGSNFQVVD